MRAAIGVTILLVFGAMVMVGAQETAEPFLVDATNDVVYLVAEEQPVPTSPVTSHGRADLTSLAITETQDELIFHVAVEDISEFPDGSGLFVDAARLDVRFSIGGLHYDVGTGIRQQGETFAEIRGGNADQSEPIILGTLPVQQTGSTFSVTVPRELMRDEQGAPVQTGMQLSNLRVDSHVHATGLFLQNPDGSLFQPLGIRDRMPNSEFATFDVLDGGPVSSGEMRLETPTPFRASNGGEATIAYSYILHNDAATDVTFDVSVNGIPSGWDVDYLPTVAVDQSSSVIGSIVVHTPFGHEHGGTQEFQLIIARTDGSAEATATMGILYLDIPQPAGHHNIVYLHSQDTAAFPAAAELIHLLGAKSGELWMNTLQEDPQDQAAAIYGIHDGGMLAPTSTGYDWYICLNPHLQLGLDFNNNVGTANLALSSQTPLAGTLSGSLLHVAPGDRLGPCLPGEWSQRETMEVATIAASALAELNGGQQFNLDITATDQGEFVQFQPDTDLVLHVRFELDGAAPAPPIGPRLEPGGSLQLPLDEYFDEHPPGIVHVGDEEHDHDEAEPPQTPATKRTPALGVVLPALAVLALANRRRL